MIRERENDGKEQNITSLAWEHKDGYVLQVPPGELCLHSLPCVTMSPNSAYALLATTLNWLQ